MKYFNRMFTKLSWVLILVELLALFALMFLVVEAASYLNAKLYNPNVVVLNIVFYLSPIIGLLVTKETDSEVFILGVISLSAFTLFIDIMYIVHLFEHEAELGIRQWLYIVPATVVSTINYQLIRHARIQSYCPSCRARIRVKHNFCYNCGLDLHARNRAQ